MTGDILATDWLDPSIGLFVYWISTDQRLDPYYGGILGDSIPKDYQPGPPVVYHKVRERIFEV